GASRKVSRYQPPSGWGSSRSRRTTSSAVRRKSISPLDQAKRSALEVVLGLAHREEHLRVALAGQAHALGQQRRAQERVGGLLRAHRGRHGPFAPLAGGEHLVGAGLPRRI